MQVVKRFGQKGIFGRDEKIGPLSLLGVGCQKSLESLFRCGVKSQFGVQMQSDKISIAWKRSLSASKWNK